MTIDSQNLLESILESLDRIDYIHPEDVPGIDLYMDQVTTFMDSQLKSSKRYEDDKILTKTMINNYAKNRLLPPPEKKKYSREHMLLLIFIYYFKTILSIKDIETVLKPLKGKYFSGEEEVELSDLYEEVCRMEKNRIAPLQETVKAAYDRSRETFSGITDEENKEELQLFAFICNLSFDVYLKKTMIEKIIDGLAEKKAEEEPDKTK